MTSWTRIREVFEAALELDERERNDLLDRQDPVLRSEVLRLLAADQAESPVLDRLADELLDDLGEAVGPAPTDGGTSPAPAGGTKPSASTEPLVGRSIGKYRIESMLAGGGMGTVYVALQDQPKRRVALKVMKRELISAAGRRRFEYEAAILARMRHPGIAQIFEAGSFHDEFGPGDVPFFAMEFIEGARNIVEYARDEQLDLRARLELFEKVCSIVHYGHQQGVIHRDLKPSNILVDALGRPRVIDFGIARAVELEVENEDARQTRMGEVLGTVQYMSPEQMAGNPDAIDTRSDIYALGVMLYELLCGCSPFPLVNKSLVEAARIVAETEPVRPDRLRPELPKELVWVTLKTLEKDRDQRYTSAAELGEEIRRFLANRPVHAMRPSVRYRLKKLLQRNRSEAVIGGLLLAAVTLGPVITSLILARTNNRLQVANARYGRLADSLRLEDLDARADELWPATPERVGDLRAWLRDATAVTDRLETHRRTLAALQRAADVRDSAEIRWQHQTLVRLVADLTRFTDPDPDVGTFANVQRRLSWARTVVRRSIGDHETGWAEACAAIAASPFYAGMSIAPQVGLVPLGPDAHSGLWEFAHLESGEAAERGSDGSLTLRPASGIVLVLVPAGSFLMGAVAPSAPASAIGSRDPFAAPDESPVRRVELEPFFVSKYETTQAQWERLSGSNPSYFQGSTLTDGSPLTDADGAQIHPVEQVGWREAIDVLTRHGLTLPTEAQWEYAARAGTQTVWWSGDDRESLRGAVNIADQSAQRAGQDWEGIADWADLDDGYPFHCPVDAFRPNPFGLHNVLGNVYEWCLDGFAEYSIDPDSGDGKRTGDTSHARCIRGGSFIFAASKARAADRGFLNPDSFDLHLGVRATRSLDPHAPESSAEQARAED